MLARVHSAALAGDRRPRPGRGGRCLGRAPLFQHRRDSRTRASGRPANASARRSATPGFRSPEALLPSTWRPAGFKKVGASLDLPVAVAILEICGLASRAAARRLFVGELGLNGEVRPVRGALCLALAARDAGFDEIVLPCANAAEAAAVEGIAVIPVGSLASTVAHVNGQKTDRAVRRARGRPGSAQGVGLLRYPGPDGRAPRARDRRRGRAPRPAHGPAGRGKDDARPAAADGPAGPDARRVDRGHEGPFRRGRSSPFRRARRNAPVPRPASRDLRARPRRRRRASGPGRDLPGAPGSAVPGRAARVPARRPGGDPPAPGRKARQPGPRRRRLHLPVRFPARRRDEPVSLRLRGRSAPGVHLRLSRAPALHEEDLRAAARRIDLHVSVPPVSWADIQKSAPEEASETIKRRVARARRLAVSRFPGRPAFRNADLAAADFERFLCLDAPVRRVAAAAVERLSLLRPRAPPRAARGPHDRRPRGRARRSRRRTWPRPSPTARASPRRRRIALTAEPSRPYDRLQKRVESFPVLVPLKSRLSPRGGFRRTGRGLP